MKKFLLILISTLAFAIFFQPRANPASSSGNADFLWRQLCTEIDLNRLLHEKENFLRLRKATFDADNNCYYLEFPAAIPENERMLASISFTEKNLVKIRIFPPPETQMPFFAGFIRIGSRQSLLRGCVSDYSDRLCGDIGPELL